MPKKILIKNINFLNRDTRSINLKSQIYTFHYLQFSLAHQNIDKN